ncbi:hypothetical protein AM493_05360 [Flavobacterium akiainvivens]|uniref:Uncharacterized protein n=1 Tax=Flavobacterium akiainvivens TaxID=1202724 RepID=A0A0N0RQI5_9FLAO|nr:hypothetical protein [Flavobacterium akiainvivens]KOS05522.1 hypothetical protein AM493_05360 [Flavobacterium akiainvivens]SFQ33584.1 hypothetical protein SAMN05444144_103107 [Flavobacterium akiainvivens]
MKTTNTLRILAGLSFLIFFCPFFQMCSDEDIPKMVKEAASAEPDSITGEITPPKIDEIAIKEREAQKQEYLEEHRQEWIFNAYKICHIYGGAFTQEGEIDSKDLKDSAFWFVVFFLLSVLTSLILFVLALLKKIKAAFIGSCINIVFIILYSLFLFVGDNSIEHLYQVKFGYYLFVINSIALIFVSNKAKNQPVNGV